MGACFLLALAASVYLVYVLEILKLRKLRAWQLRRVDPATTEFEIDVEVRRELETGEFSAAETPEEAPPAPSPPARPPAPTRTPS